MQTALRFIAVAALFFGLSAAHAADWRPEKPVEIISGVAAGGALDIMARAMQKIWQEKRALSVPSTVVNRPGAGSSIAWTYLNAHYLSVTSATLLTNSLTGGNALNHNDVTPLAQMLSEYVVFAVRADSPLKTGRDMVERLKKDPASLSFGLATTLGNPSHIAIAQIARPAGIDVRKLKVAVFTASPQAMTGVLGGHLDIMVSNASGPLAQIEGGQMRALAVAAPKRLAAAYATVPTLKEQGINVVAAFWRGVIGPKGMTPAQIAYWDAELARLAASDDWKKYLADHQLESDYRASREAKQFLEAEYAEYKTILGELGLAK
ncbi:MAG: tripartite tricarboxylate transporter substrate binding protein [Betaproteobacteria bacterium]|nr:tripartite tricarboxylate transporter substrate binding protein [Betaproteobacteria bacterium]